MATLDAVVRYLDEELRTSSVPDHEAALNGLQLANGGEVTRVAAAVDFSLTAVTEALRAKADLLLVHHGMFWPGAQPIVGPRYERLRAAIEGNLAVYSSHVPLDMHPELGNNALLAQELGLRVEGTFGRWRGDVEIGVMGSADVATDALVDRVRAFSAGFGTTAVHTPFDHARRTRRWAIITGAGASPATLDEARARGIDTFIVGEGPHHTGVEAREWGLVIIYGGHYATETPGVRALAARLEQRFGVSSVFVDAPTGL